MTPDDRLRDALRDPTRKPSADFAGRVMAALPARRVSRPWPLRALAASLGVAVIVAAVLLGTAGPATPPTPAARATAAATVGPTIARYPDGLPRRLDGQPVLRGEAIPDHVARTRIHPGAFLIGGYVTEFIADCFIEPAPPVSPLLDHCGIGFDLIDARNGRGLGLGLRLVIDADLRGLLVLDGSAPVILRVHAFDSRAADCPPAIRQRCDEAIVVEAVVWSETVTIPLALDPDGIPTKIDGEFVLRGDAITGMVAATQDDTPFLVAGWATGQRVYRCAPATAERPPHLLLPCGPSAGFDLMDGPDRADGLLVKAIDRRLLPAPGRVVLRVHVHDSLGASCPATNRALCEATLVIDEIAWTAGSTPRP